jgi:hypothetical protein
MTGDQEGDALGDDVNVVKLLARLTIDDGQHAVEQVVDGTQGAGRTAFLDDLLHCLQNELLVG